MKPMASLAVLTVLLALQPCASCFAASDQDGVALAIIYDTSGSMKDPVRDQTGKYSPKYLIANRALLAITRQIQTFATNTAAGPPRKVDVGLYVFNNNGARAAVRFGPFDPHALQDFARNFSNPSGNTPLGNSLRIAGNAVLASALSHKHVLVITDGMNTAGPSPALVLPELKRQAEQQRSSLSVHFVAFDVNAQVFDPVKQQGATVVAASNENQLNTQLQFILERKILLEEEEPAKPK
jgi:VWA domain-containing protein